MRTRLATPYLVGLAFLIALPALGAVVLAFTDHSGISTPRFVGLDNFERMFGDPGFHGALWNSVLHIVLSVPLRMAAVIVFALILHERFRGAGMARAGVYLPSVIPDAAFGLLWLWLLNPIYGPVSALVGGMGFEAPDILSSPWGARTGVAVMSVFQIGEGFVIALAARRLLDRNLYDAARADGASPWFTLRKITLPLMAPVLVLLAARDVTLALQTNFVPALLVTDGGPRLATTYLPLYAYRQAFRYFRLGYASAITVSMFVLTAGAIYVQYRMARRYKLL